MNFIITLSRCHGCLKSKKAQRMVNRKLPYDKQITKKENREWEHHRLNVNPIMDQMKDFKGYPHNYFDGIELGPDHNEKIMAISMAKIVEEHMTSPLRIKKIINQNYEYEEE